MAGKKNVTKYPSRPHPEAMSEDDPLREESTDYRAPGEKFEVLPSGKNLDLNRMDQPRTNLASLPKAHKDRERGNKRPEGVPTRPGAARDKKKRAA